MAPRQMRVGFFVGYMFPPKFYGGGDLVHRKIFSYLKERGVDVESVCMAEVVEEGRTRVKRLMEWPVIGTLLVSTWCLRYILRGFTINLIADYYKRHLILYILLSRLLYNSKTVIYAHHYDYYRSTDTEGPRKRWVRFKERCYFAFANHIVANSNFTKSEIISFGVSPEKITVVHPGISVEDFKVYEKKATPHINLFYVGHCRPRKGLNYLVEALGRLKQDRFHLDVVGRLEDESFYEMVLKRVKELNLTGKVSFHGRVDQDTLSRLYSQADIFVYPSLWEGFGIVFLEAMYYCLPIISSNVSAIPELVRHGENGLLIPPGDVEALSRAIKQLMEDETLRKVMGRRGHERVKQSYSWEEAGQRVYEILQIRLKGCWHV